MSHFLSNAGKSHPTKPHRINLLMTDIRRAGLSFLLLQPSCLLAKDEASISARASSINEEWTGVDDVLYEADGMQTRSDGRSRVEGV